MSFAAVVLAGDRGPGDPVARAGGAPCKALVPVGGIPMVVRVLDALAASRGVDTVSLCGPAPEALEGAAGLAARVAAGTVAGQPAGATPAASAAAGLAALDVRVPAMVTTADHALLSPALVDEFLARAADHGADAVVGLVALETVRSAFPAARRTEIRLREGAFCGTNLFAFPTPAGRRAVDAWQRVEAQRKRPWRLVAGVLGPAAVLRYAAGRLSVEEAMARLSRAMGVRVGAVELSRPEAGVDVDTVEDLALAEAFVVRGAAMTAAP